MQRAEEIVQEVMQDFRLSQSDASSSYDEVSDVGEAYDDFATNDAQLRGDARRPPVTGKSLFTQEEFSNQHHSLAEFEKMEAEMERGTGAREEADHDADVIGAYLQGGLTIVVTGKIELSLECVSMVFLLCAGLKRTVARDDSDDDVDEEIVFHSENEKRRQLQQQQQQQQQQLYTDDDVTHDSATNRDVSPRVFESEQSTYDY